MKKQIFFSAVLTITIYCLLPVFSFAQAPQAFKYQSIVRNAAGNPMVNAAISVRATVHEGSATGTSAYQEVHSVTTNQFGLINLEIGNGTSVSGTFPSINWGAGTKWMEIEADFGSGFVSMGTSQLLSVPYALNFVPGPAGPQGPAGINGTNGINGLIGLTGAAGTNGTNGTNGSIGLTGAAGINGTNGTNGTNGIDGTNGTNGTNGTIGLTGAPGTNGTNGIDGVNGLAGAAGTNGTNGTNGIDGAIGLTGSAGTNGTNGTNGIDGVNGLAGTAGTNGTNGTNGIDGVNGLAGTNGTNGTNGIDGVNGLAGSAGTNGTNGTNGIDGVNGLAGTNGTNGTNGIDGVNGLAGSAGTNGTNGTNGIDGATGATGAISEFAMFYGLTTGTGNGAGTDYAATLTVKTGAGTGRVSFPRNGPAAGIVRIDNTSFTLPDIGTYEITFSIHTTEAGQLQLELNGVDLPETVSADMNPTAGGHSITGNYFVTTTGLNSTLAVVNPSGNTPALTITSSDGASTHANSQSLTIKKIF